MGVTLRLHGDLAMFAPARWRAGVAEVEFDGTSSLGHLVESRRPVGLEDARLVALN
jgi:hypothetical protein